MSRDREPKDYANDSVVHLIEDGNETEVACTEEMADILLWVTAMNLRNFGITSSGGACH